MGNPDNPKKCTSLMKDGIHCWDKSVTNSYEDEVINGEKGWLIKCPFIKEMEKNDGKNSY